MHLALALLTSTTQLGHAVLRWFTQSQMLYMSSWIGLLTLFIDSKVSNGRVVALVCERSEKVILDDTCPFYRFQPSSQEVHTAPNATYICKLYVTYGRIAVPLVSLTKLMATSVDQARHSVRRHLLKTLSAGNASASRAYCGE